MFFTSMKYIAIVLCITSAFTEAFSPSCTSKSHAKLLKPSAISIPSLEFKYSNTVMYMNINENSSSTAKSNLPMLLDPGTKGGALFLSLVLFIVPIMFYEIITLGLGVDGIEAGKWIGVGFTAFTTVLWVGSYIFRVATKDMTYAKQLKDYENAVIAKRLEELDEDEIQALVEDIERDDF